MKNIKIALFGFVATAMMFASCSDPCKDVDCNTNGECVEGSCVCNSGYEGTNCETAVNAKFAGTYAVPASGEVCTSGTYGGWSCGVTASSTSPSTITFDNLYDAGLVATAEVADNGTDFTISSQTFGTTTISGSGSINTAGTTITVSYTIGASDDVCNNVTLNKL